jgi:hypothetical protein
MRYLGFYLTDVEGLTEELSSSGRQSTTRDNRKLTGGHKNKRLCIDHIQYRQNENDK